MSAMWQRIAENRNGIRLFHRDKCATKHIITQVMVSQINKLETFLLNCVLAVTDCILSHSDCNIPDVK